MVEAVRLKKDRVMSVEVWRFAFTVLVSVYHLELFFFSSKNYFPSGTGAVEFFFILAGFTLAMSAKRRMEQRDTPLTPKEAHALAIDFVKKKLKAIYPILVLVIILGFIVYPIILKATGTFWYTESEGGILGSLMRLEWEWLLMVGTPFGFNDGYAPIIPMWFLTALLVVGYIYTYAIHRHYDFVRFAAPVIGVLGYILFTLNSTDLRDHAIAMGFLNAGTLHAVSEMALGISIFQLYEYLSKKKFNLFWKILLSLFELYAVYRLFSLILWQEVGYDNFRKVVYLMIIILLSFLNVTLLSKVLNRKAAHHLGKISLPMYLCHYQLIPVYLGGLSAIAQYVRFPWNSSRILEWIVTGTGGNGGFGMTQMTIKDMILYTVLLIIVSLLVLLIIRLVKTLFIRLRKKPALVEAGRIIDDHIEGGND